jgi:hypothetical protein
MEYSACRSVHVRLRRQPEDQGRPRGHVHGDQAHERAAWRPHQGRPEVSGRTNVLGHARRSRGRRDRSRRLCGPARHGELCLTLNIDPRVER